MAWTDYQYQAGEPGGTLVDLSDFCTKVRIVGETVPGKRGTNPVVQYRDGEQSSPRKFLRASDFILETHLRYTDASGVVTDPDGKAGEVYSNKAAVSLLLSGRKGKLARVQRIAPHQGQQYKDIELLGEAMPTQFRHVYGWPCHAPNPYWQGQLQTTNPVVNPLIVGVAGGDGPVGELAIKFTDPGGALDPKVVNDDTGDFVQIVGALPAGGVIVDVVNGTATRITGGADWSNYLRMSVAFQFWTGTNNVTVTGGATLNADWRVQWT